MSEEKKGKDLVVFLDTIGRTIIGERMDDTDTTMGVKNPAVVNVVPQQVQDPNTGQTVQRMALQLFPLFFREFLAAKDEAVVFDYNKNNITPARGNVVLDAKVSIQYEQLFMVMGEVTTPGPVAPQPSQETPDNTIQLFDD